MPRPIYNPSLLKAVYKAGPVAVGPSVSTEVTLIDQTIPGGLLGVRGAVRCLVDGNFLNNGAAGQTVTLRVYAAGTKIYDGVSGGYTQSANRRGLWLDMVFANRNSESANELAGFLAVGNANAPTAGISNLAAGFANSSFGSGQVAIDTSASWAFKVTVQLSASETTLEMPVSLVLLEVL